MKKTFLMMVAIACAASMLLASEDWRGNNRLAGYLVDKNSGKPVPNAKLHIRIAAGSKGGPDTAADANGKWAVLGLKAGVWNLDAEAPGYVVRQIGGIVIAEGQRLPPMKIEMEPAAAAAAADTPGEPTREEVKIGGQTVSKEVADAVEAGNTALGAKNFAEAIAAYEKVNAAVPNYGPIKFALARSYYGAGNLQKAIATMTEVVTADPTNTQDALLLANMLLEDGQLDKAKEVIEKLPEGSLTMDTLLNTGIAMMNKKQPTGALTYFNKAIAAEPTSHLGYYYRGLAYVQMNKLKDAKPDLQKVVELAPDSQEAKDAKEYLKSIK